MAFKTPESSKRPSAVQEAALMAELLSGLDAEDIFSYVPSPDVVKTRPRTMRLTPRKAVTPRKAPISCPKSRAKVVGGTVCNEDLDALLDGAADWSWDDVLTPVKASSRKARRDL